MVRTRRRPAAPPPAPSSSGIRRPRNGHGLVRKAPPVTGTGRRLGHGRAQPAGRVAPRVQPAGRRVVVLDSDSEAGDVSIVELGSGRSSPGGGLDDSVEMDDSRLNMSHNEYVADSFVVHDDSDEEESSEDDDNLSFESGDEGDVVDMDESSIVEVRADPDPNDDDLDDLSDVQSVSSADSSVAADLNKSMPADVIRSSEHGHCSICFEDAPYDPMGCIMCRQLIGCKRCVDKWFRTGQKKKERREENAENHFMCPLCRHPWEAAPEIDTIFALD